MITTDLKSALEALLFVSDEPVSGARLSQALDQPAGDIDSALAEMAEEYKSVNRGFQLREVAGGWRFFTHPAHHELIENYVLSWDTRRLSQASLEVLSVIAYRQPVTRNIIGSVRGVNSEGVIGSLIEKGLVREAGRDRNQGNAILYETTRTFLEKFGLKSVEDLPDISEFLPDNAAQKIIKSRMGMTEEAAEGAEIADQFLTTEDLEDATHYEISDQGNDSDDASDSDIEEILEVN